MAQARKAVHEGWLHKLGARVKNWKHRYFVLHEGELAYFHTEGEGDKPLGTIALDAGVTHIALAPDSKFKRAHCVEIRAEKRVFVASAASQADAEEWVERLCGAWQHRQQLAAPNHPDGESEEGDPLAGLGDVLEGGPAPPLAESIQAGDNPLASTYKLDGKAHERAASDVHQDADVLLDRDGLAPKHGGYARVDDRAASPPKGAVTRPREPRPHWDRACACCAIL